MDPQQLLSRLKALGGNFTTSQLVSMAGAFVVVVGLIAGSTWWLNKPTFALLYSEMDAETAGQMVNRLKTLKVPYELDAGGTAIRVPQDRVDELRLEMSSQGMPASGRVGFEIFDRTAFGATQFLEQVNYRRALEGEIARTIATITEVSNARVHIAMGKESLFGDPRPAKASVVLKLKGQRTLSESTINGISNLVASSVEGLRPDAVVILDSFGRPLARPQDGTDPMGAVAMERQQRLEREMAERVVALLEPVVGVDRVRVNVAVKLNPQSREETEERWDPNTVVRSQQKTADQAVGLAASNVPAGTRGNAPPQLDAEGKPIATAPQVTTGPGSSRTAETTNYEVGRVTRHVIQPPGDVARLSVAVILDDDQVGKPDANGLVKVARKPRTPEELQKIQGLVAAAVGLETARGDQLTVENVSFDEPVFEEEPPPTLLEKVTPQLWEGSRIAAVALVGFLAFVMIVRPMLRRAGVKTEKQVEELAAAAVAMPAGGPAAPRTVADLESEIDAELDQLIKQNADSRRLPVLTRRVSAVTVNEPEHVAKLLKGWIQETER